MSTRNSVFFDEETVRQYLMQTFLAKFSDWSTGKWYQYIQHQGGND